MLHVSLSLGSFASHQQQHLGLGLALEDGHKRSLPGGNYNCLHIQVMYQWIITRNCLNSWVMIAIWFLFQNIFAISQHFPSGHWCSSWSHSRTPLVCRCSFCPYSILPDHSFMVCTSLALIQIFVLQFYNQDLFCRRICEWLLIRDQTLIPNVIFFEYTSHRHEIRARSRKLVSMKSQWILEKQFQFSAIKLCSTQQYII